ncbi:ZGRF1, partial [Symbiodinium sp. CCMP2456]
MQEGTELADLSAEQRQVVHHLTSWLHPGGSNNVPTLLRGVFGSGKSRTLAACIVSLDRLLRARRDTRRILLLCQTNVAVDTVLHHLLSHFGWDDFARLGSFRSVDPELLYRTVSLMSSRPAAAKELSDALQRRPPEVRQALQSAIDHGLLPPKPTAWRRRRLVAATTAALESADLSPDVLSCPFVLVDEATQLTEPAIFYALQKARAEEVLLVGDPRQLPPRAVHAPLQLSALERLWDQKGACRLELATQFRCHPCIAGFCSSLFYGGALKSGITAEDRTSGLGPGAAPLAVVLSEGPETRVGQSFRHDAEAQLCSSWLKRASSCGRLQPKDFGVICLYRPHADACGRAVRSSGALKDVEVATVDAFQ